MDRPRSRVRRREPRGHAIGWIGSTLLHLGALTAVAALCHSVRVPDSADPTVIGDDAFTTANIVRGEDLPLRWRNPAQQTRPEGDFVSDGTDDRFDRPVEPADDMPRGRAEAVADSEMGGEGPFMDAAAGGGTCGMFGVARERRTETLEPAPRERTFGASQHREMVLNAAIAWLSRTQRDDGRWSADGDRASGVADPIATSLAAWFLLRCVSDTIGICPRARHPLQRAVIALCAAQDADGALAPWPTHALATAVIAAAATDHDLDARSQVAATAAAAPAMRLLWARRRFESVTGGSRRACGWGGGSAGIDAWTTAWSCIALAQVAPAGDDDAATLRSGIEAWLDGAAASSPTGRFPPRWPLDGPSGSGVGDDVAAFALLAGIHAHVPASHAAMRRLLNDLDEVVPAAGAIGDPALRWSQAMIARCRLDWRWLVDSHLLFQRLLWEQRPNGSWDEAPSGVAIGGRVGTTALNGLAALAVECDVVSIGAQESAR